MQYTFYEEKDQMPGFIIWNCAHSIVAISKMILHKLNYSANIKHNNLVSLKQCSINMFYRKLTQLQP